MHPKKSQFLSAEFSSSSSLSSKFSLPEIVDGEDKSSPFVNRIRKNYRHIRKWAKRTLTNAFRIFDRDIRQYPVAIEYYDGRLCIQYFSITRESTEPPAEFICEVEKALKTIFGEACRAIYWKTRAKRKETRQYEKVGESREFFTVLEYGIPFKVNLQDYLDTGLFLDHRETRHLIGKLSRDKRVLNLFAYTCSFSIHAAVAGASFTKSVDLSNTYTAWGRDNFRLNGFSPENHPIIREDCMKFLEEEVRIVERGRLNPSMSALFKYDIIIIDPPTISRSKKMSDMFDVQEDYVSLISNGLKLLSKGGMIFFSTNSRKFVFDKEKFPSCEIREITERTLPIDFHDPKIHRCWRLSI